MDKKVTRLTGGLLQILFFNIFTLIIIALFWIAIIFFFTTITETKESLTQMILFGFIFTAGVLYGTIYIIKRLNFTIIEFSTSEIKLIRFNKSLTIPIDNIQSIKRNIFGDCCIIYSNLDKKDNRIYFKENFLSSFNSLGGKTSNYKFIETQIKSKNNAT